jgi:hypothetical protein
MPPVGVGVSSAFLPGLDLAVTILIRPGFSSADLRNGNFAGDNFALAPSTIPARRSDD